MLPHGSKNTNDEKKLLLLLRSIPFQSDVNLLLIFLFTKTFYIISKNKFKLIMCFLKKDGKRQLLQQKNPNSSWDFL